MVKDLITPRSACLYLDSIYYNHTINLNNYIITFTRHLSRNVWSFYTLHLIMDIQDIPYLKECTPSQFDIDHPEMRTLMPDVYKHFLNITIQHIKLRFNNGLSSTFKEFESDSD